MARKIKPKKEVKKKVKELANTMETISRFNLNLMALLKSVKDHTTGVSRAINVPYLVHTVTKGMSKNPDELEVECGKRYEIIDGLQLNIVKYSSSLVIDSRDTRDIKVFPKKDTTTAVIYDENNVTDSGLIKMKTFSMELQKGYVMSYSLIDSVTHEIMSSGFALSSEFEPVLMKALYNVFKEDFIEEEGVDNIVLAEFDLSSEEVLLNDE